MRIKVNNISFFIFHDQERGWACVTDDYVALFQWFIWLNKNFVFPVRPSFRPADAINADGTTDKKKFPIVDVFVGIIIGSAFLTMVNSSFCSDNGVNKIGFIIVVYYFENIIDSL